MSDTLIKLRIGIILVLTMLLSYVAMKTMGLPPFGVDDANILFVYSKHFAAGEGLVYNIGGERVEGFSSMLWMLITAAGYLVTDFPYPLFLMINVLMIGGALGYAIHYVEVHFGDPEGRGSLPFSLSGMLVIAWVIGSPGYFLWTVSSLMETGLWSALLIVTSVFLLKVIDYGRVDAYAVRIFSLLFAALILTRPEGVAWVMTFAALLLLVVRQQGATFTGVLQSFGVVTLVSVATLGLLVLFRLWYFGYPLPNTYYVKVTPDKLYNLRFGIIYLVQFIKASPLVVVCMAAAAFSFVRTLWPALTMLVTGDPSLDRRRLAEFALAGIVLVGTLLPVLMGGDIFGAYRFYQPIWPLYILVLFYLPLPAHWWRIGRPAVTLAVSAVAILVLTYSNTVRWPGLGDDRERIVHLYELTERHMTSGHYLERLFGDFDRGLPSIGVSAAGGHKIGYAGEVIDTMGLNYLAMAHHDGDKKGTRGHAAFSEAVFWQRPTDLFEPTLCARDRPAENRYKNPDNWMYEIYRGMPGDDRFNDFYKFIALEVPATDDRICTYVSRDWLAAMAADGGYRWESVD